MNLILAHGSSSGSHGKQVKAVAESVSMLLGEEVGTAFLSDNNLPEGARVVPLFLGAGKHLSEDVPALIARSKSSLMLPALEKHADRLAAMAGDLAEDILSDETDLIFAVYHFHGFEAVTTTLKKQFSQRSLAAIHASPSVGEVLLLRRGVAAKPVLVQPMLLFEGRTMAALRQTVAESSVNGLTGPVLSSHADFPAFIADCFRGSLLHPA